MVAEASLQSPYLKDGIQYVSWWNGRALTAEDLRDAQLAVDRSDRHLGEVLGDGVARGLVVSREPEGTAVQVTPGRAVNPAGEVLALDNPLRVLLLPPTAPAAEGGASFVACADVPPSTTPTGSGIYLLTLASAAGTKGSALSGRPAREMARACGPRYTVAGVQFRVVEVDVLEMASATGHDQADLDTLSAQPGTEDGRRLANVLSHLFLGTVSDHRRLIDPFGLGSGSGPSDVSPIGRLRQDGRLSDCEVPLALLTWDRGLEDVDGWSVRRRPTVADPTIPAWPLFVGPRRLAAREAAFRQFQDQLARLAASAASRATRVAIRAVDHFRYLPAAGFVPTSEDAEAGQPQGFDSDRFFEGITTQTVATIAADRVEALIRQSLAFPPIDLAAGELVARYRVRETTAAVNAADAATPPVQPFLVFSSANMPFQGGAPLEIHAVFPSGPLHPGAAIEVRGQGFGFTQGFARVRFDGIAADPQDGSTDTKLLVTVPPPLAAPEGGRQISLTVDNGTDSDAVVVTLMPREVALGGSIDVDWIEVTPEVLESNQPADFTYRVTSRLNRRADMALNVAVEPHALAAGLQARTVEGDALETLQDVEVDEVRHVVVHLDSVGEGTLRLTVTARAATISGSDVRPFEVGDESQPPDENITIEVNSFAATRGEGNLDQATSTVSLTRESVGRLNITGRFAEPGTFSRTLAVSAAGWQAAFADVSDPIVVDEGDIGAGGTAGRPLDFALSPDPEASAAGTVTLTIQRQGGERSRTKVFTLQLLS